MSSKMGKRETAKKPTTVRRTSAKTDGAFGKEQAKDLFAGEELNVDKAAKPHTSEKGHKQ